MNSPAVFLDRDGTIIEDCGYIDDPGDVRLLPGAAEAIRRWRRAGFKVVVVSNQSGIARGYFDEDTLSEVHTRFEALLDESDATLDGAYYCPYLPGKEASVKQFRRDSELRKPKPGMLLQASRELHIDTSRSWMVGDKPSDVEAGKKAGCRTILLQPNGQAEREDTGCADYVVQSVLQAVDVVEREMSKTKGKIEPVQTPSRDDEIVEWLAKIHAQNERSNRRDRQLDFSTLRLFGALLQMLAIVAALWGFSVLLDEQDATASARFLLACFFQLASLSAFAIDRFR